MLKVAYVGTRLEEIKDKIQEYTEVIVTDYTLKTVIPDTEDIVVIDSKTHITKLKIEGRGTIGVVLSHNRQGLLCLMKNGVKCVLPVECRVRIRFQ